ncbi:hypothetical protein LTR56_011162 [Elasticomyces elasticus]|nr:hypothetical protein LTR56_011162 [Elasticomyces elasticus]KAK3662417.1 hypothetical protein LTR22_006696 [Elasticomyces elasticus]KAK4926406.1 hypothetical protein LTR49_006613 [Elasticomyces elasticus]KAK5761221.1 hypothetical protein LTS12_008702 [Elasticomyces elasticus]
MYPALEVVTNIRLLVLGPGDRDADIQCHLVQAQMGPRSVPYEALSYCWGPASEGRTVTCNGEIVSITDNLHAALLQLRQTDVERTLWVDALSINQQDDREKTQMVLRMRDTYASARGVIIWLGLGDESSQQAELAFTLLSRLATTYISYNKDERYRGWLIQEYQTKRASWWPEFRAEVHAATEALKISSESWAALGSLLWRPWFYRIWVVQEAVMAGLNDPQHPAPVFVCGRCAIGWDTFIAPLLGLRILDLDYQLWSHIPKTHVNPALAKPFSGGINMIRNIVKLRLEGIERLWPRRFYDLLRLTKTMDSTDPRDKVFALHGMLVPDQIAVLDNSLQPDYAKPLDQVYMDVAKHFILKQHSLKLLEMVHDNPRHHTDLPSWIPDWKASSYTSPLAEFRYSAGYRVGSTDTISEVVSEFEESFLAGARQSVALLPGNRPIATISNDGKLLTLQGFMLAPITCAVPDASELTPDMLRVPDIPRHSPWFQRLASHTVYQNILAAVNTLDPSCTQDTREDGQICWDLPADDVPYDGGGTLIEALWRTLIGDRNEGITRPQNDEWQASFMAFDQWRRLSCFCQKHQGSVKGPVPEGLDAMAARFDSAMRRIAPGRRFAIVAEQLLCWVPQRANTCDFIIVAHGSDIAHVVRRRPGADHVFELLGGAYVHGFMHGEAIRKFNVQTQSIVLS